MYDVGKDNLKSMEADDDRTARSIKKSFRPHRRFFVDTDLEIDKRVELVDESLLHQLLFVFRVKLGDEILLLDNSGFEYSGVIKGVGKKEIIVQIKDKKEGLKPNVEVNVFQSVLKKDNVELSLEKCTEIGITKFIPMTVQRSIKSNLNYDRLQKIAKEASEQCGRAIMPKIEEVNSFYDAMNMALSEKDAVNFIFHEESEECCDKLSCEFLQNFKDVKKFNLFIGPEGGFTEGEVTLAKNSNFYVLSLGNLVLRSETAAIVASALVINK